jgi:hypothetical protein
MNKIAEEIKDYLTLKLAEQGKSVVDFENELQQLNTLAGAEKVASSLAGAAVSPLGFLGGVPGGVGSVTSGYMGAALPLSFGVGAAGGSLLAGADRSLDEMNEALDAERKKLEYIHNLRKALEAEHGIAARS